MNDLLIGVRSVTRGLGLVVREPRVRRLAIAPLIVNVLLIIVGLPLLLWLGGSLGASIIPGSSELAAGFRVVLSVLVAIVVALVGIIVLLVLARIIAAPMMSRLSEAVEAAVLGERYVPRQTTLRDEAADIGRGLAFALGRLLIFIALYPLILLVGLIPGAGVFLAPLLTFLYGAFVLSLDFSEPAFERHLPGFRNRIAHIRRRPLLYLGFGGVAVAMTLIPFANLAVLPVCIAGATVAFLVSRDDNVKS